MDLSIQFLKLASRNWIVLNWKSFSIWGKLKFPINWGIFRIPTNNCENISVHFSAIFYELAPILSDHYLEHPKSKTIQNKALEVPTLFSRNLWFFPTMILAQVHRYGWDLALDFQQPNHILIFKSLFSLCSRRLSSTFIDSHEIYRYLSCSLLSCTSIPISGSPALSEGN
jgi:hypothetical protein